jgi:hypothetical protein
MFSSLVPYIKDRLEKHHKLYSGQCKAEYWEENLSWALKQAGFGSNWRPDFNHKSGVDQITDSGIHISNKGGSLNLDYIKISGSRLTKHKSIQEKLNFLSDKTEDYILCLATEKSDWTKNIKRYYFIVIDSKKLNYHQQEWEETYGVKGSLKNEVNGWKCEASSFSAEIRKTMSDQLWTEVKLDSCEEIYEFTIG